MISLIEQQRRIEGGELSPEAALAQSMVAIAAQEKTIGAFASLTEDPPARRIGPLRGIAVGIKDIIDTADLPTEMGSSIYRGFRPRADAPVVTMLKQAGATIVGKTATTAFAANDPTPTLNPRNHGRLVFRISRRGSRRHASLGIGHADRWLGYPSGLILWGCRDQAFVSLASDHRGQVFFLDAGHCRPLCRRSCRSRSGPGGDDEPACAAR